MKSLALFFACVSLASAGEPAADPVAGFRKRNADAIRYLDSLPKLYAGKSNELANTEASAELEKRMCSSLLLLPSRVPDLMSRAAYDQYAAGLVAGTQAPARHNSVAYYKAIHGLEAALAKAAEKAPLKSDQWAQEWRRLEPACPGFSRKRWDQVLLESKAELEQDPQNIKAMLWIGRAYDLTDRAKEAEAAYEAVMKAYPREAGAFRYRALMRERLGLPGVEADFAKVLDLFPDDPEALRWQGDRAAADPAHAKQQFQEAIDAYTKALKSRPDADTYFKRGQAHLGLCRAYENCTSEYLLPAIEDYAKAADLEPVRYGSGYRRAKAAYDEQYRKDVERYQAIRAQNVAAAQEEAAGRRANSALSAIGDAFGSAAMAISNGSSAGGSRTGSAAAGSGAASAAGSGTSGADRAAARAEQTLQDRRSRQQQEQIQRNLDRQRDDATRR